MAAASGFVPYCYRYALFLMLCGIALLYAAARNHSLTALGITTAFLRPALSCNILFAAVTAISIISFHRAGWITPPANYDAWLPYALFYGLIGAPAQEFVYRGLLFAELERFHFTTASTIITSATAFALIHAMYGPATVFVAFLAGLAWGWIYRRAPNLAGITLSHAIIGLIAMACGAIAWGGPHR